MSEMPHEASQGATAENIRRTGRASVYDLFHAWARQTPDALAIETAGRPTTYAQLDTRVRALANALHQRGLRRGDRLAILSENRPEYIETMLAAAALGVIVACQNWRLSVPELEHCVKLVTPKMAFVSARHAALFAAANTGVADVLEIGAAYEELLASASSARVGEAIPDVDVEAEDGIIIIYTSGTTGMPKGALVSHRAEIARMTVLRMDMRVDEEDHFVAWAPMFHMGSADQLLGRAHGRRRGHLRGRLRLPRHRRRHPRSQARLAAPHARHHRAGAPDGARRGDRPARHQGVRRHGRSRPHEARRRVQRGAPLAVPEQLRRHRDRTVPGLASPSPARRHPHLAVQATELPLRAPPRRPRGERGPRRPAGRDLGARSRRSSAATGTRRRPTPATLLAAGSAWGTCSARTPTAPTTSSTA